MSRTACHPPHWEQPHNCISVSRTMPRIGSSMTAPATTTKHRRYLLKSMTRKSGRPEKQAQDCRRPAGFLAILLMIVLALLVTACSRLPLPSGDSGSDPSVVTEPPSPTPTLTPTPLPTPTPTPTPMPSPTPTPEPTVRIRIGMVGDMLMHDPVIRGGATGDGGYDYNYMFDYLRPEIAKLDYAIFNMEGTFGGTPYKGFPLFSAPDELAEACAAAGFHCAVTANNHILDRKTAGLQRTLQVLRAAGLDTVGARLTPEESPILIKEVSGIKLAISAYTWETIRQGENSEIPAINGLRMTELDRQLVDSFSEQSKPRDFKADSVREITARAEQMRATGA
ncbi:MAG: CapA family protein, partial [Clostridiaceae bacterium]|nr:CapA family protein [Clostridiaceae bacterium]